MRRRTGLSRKILASIALVGAAAAIAGLGTFATFTSSTSVTNTIASGTLALTAPFRPPRHRRQPDRRRRHDAARDRPQLRRHDRLQRGDADDGAAPSSLLDTDMTDGPPHRDRQVLGRLD